MLKKRQVVLISDVFAAVAVVVAKAPCTTVEPLLTDTSRRRTPPVGGHLPYTWTSTAVLSRRLDKLRPPFVNRKHVAENTVREPRFGSRTRTLRPGPHSLFQAPRAEAREERKRGPRRERNENEGAA